MEELEKKYGKALTPKQLADFLGVDPRTLIKYRDKWGGIQISPGKWRFFEKIVKEVIKNGTYKEPQRQKEVCSNDTHYTSRRRDCSPVFQ
jgi:hypothetical protein